MVTYVLHTRLGLYQPDRRVNASKPPGEERRRLEPIRTTSEQYAFLRDCLERRHALHSRLAVGEHRTRDLLAIGCFVFVVLYFAAPDFVLTHIAGTEAKVTLRQLSAVMPFVLTYLIIVTCHQTRRLMRVKQECLVLDRELRRFGLATSDSLLEPFGRWCANAPWRTERTLTRMSFQIRDGYLLVSALVTFVGSFFVAIQMFHPIRLWPPNAYLGFIAYLAVASLASVSILLVLLVLRLARQEALDSYLLELDRQMASERVAGSTIDAGRLQDDSIGRGR